jgi:hypothetical protein
VLRKQRSRFLCVEVSVMCGCLSVLASVAYPGRLQRLTQLPEFEQVFLMKLENQPKVLPK